MSVRLENTNPMVNSDMLFTIEGVPGYWSKFTGVGFEVSRASYSDGLTNLKRKAASGSIAYKDFTVERAFDPEKDGAIIDFVEDAKCSLETREMTLRPVKRCNGVERRGTKAWKLSGARLKSFDTMDGMDTGDGESTVMLKLAFCYEQAAWE